MTRNLREMSTDERMELYDKAIEFHEEKGWGNRRIASVLNLKPVTVGNWLYKDVRPDGGVVFSEEKPTVQLEIDKPDEEFILWFTGFWEGEGHFKAKPSTGNRLNCELSVTQSKDRGKNVCERIQRTFGCGATSGQSRKEENHHRVYEWRIGQRRIILQIVDWMLPHLKVRLNEVKEKKQRIMNHLEESRRWTPEEEKIIHENWKRRDTELADMLNRSIESVRHKRRRMGYKKHGRGS